MSSRDPSSIPPTTPFSCRRCGHLGHSSEPRFEVRDQLLCRSCKDAECPLCPYCQLPLGKKLPVRRGKCSNCKNTVFVDHKQWLYITVLLSVEQRDRVGAFNERVGPLHHFGVNSIDVFGAATAVREGVCDLQEATARLQLLAAKYILHDHLHLLDQLGVAGALVAGEAKRIINRNWKCGPTPGLELADVLHQVLVLQDRFRSLPAPDDVAWATFVQAALLPVNQDIGDLISFAKAMHLARRGRSYSHIMKSVWRQRASRWLAEGRTHARIIGPGPPCQAARRIDGQRLPLRDVLRDPPLPLSDCTGPPLKQGGPPWCSCCLTPCINDLIA